MKAIILLIILLFLPVRAFAGDINNIFKMTYIHNSLFYREYNNGLFAREFPNYAGKYFDTENGGINGVNVSSITTLGKIYNKTNGNIQIGNLNYVGGQDNGSYGSFTYNSRDLVANINDKAGYVFNGAGFNIIPQIWVGYHEWQRQTDDENYKNGIIGAGLTIQRRIFKRTYLIASVFAGRTIFPTVHYFNMVLLPLKSSTVFSGSIELIHKFNKIYIFNKIKYESFNYGESAIINNIFEPNSSTGELTLSVGVGF